MNPGQLAANLAHSGLMSLPGIGISHLVGKRALRKSNERMLKQLAEERKLALRAVLKGGAVAGATAGAIGGLTAHALSKKSSWDKLASRSLSFQEIASQSTFVSAGEEVMDPRLQLAFTKLAAGTLIGGPGARTSLEVVAAQLPKGGGRGKLIAKLLGGGAALAAGGYGARRYIKSRAARKAQEAAAAAARGSFSGRIKALLSKRSSYEPYFLKQSSLGRIIDSNVVEKIDPRAFGAPVRAAGLGGLTGKKVGGRGKLIAALLAGGGALAAGGYGARSIMKRRAAKRLMTEQLAAKARSPMARLKSMFA